MAGRREERREAEVEGGPGAWRTGVGAAGLRDTASPSSDASPAAAETLPAPWAQPDPACSQLQKMRRGGPGSEPGVWAPVWALEQPGVQCSGLRTEAGAAGTRGRCGVT